MYPSHSMQLLHRLRQQPDKRGLPDAVRPVLRPFGSVSTATAQPSRGDVGIDCAPPRRAKQSRCFVGHEGFGCMLSLSEVMVLERVWTEPFSWELAL